MATLSKGKHLEKDEVTLSSQVKTVWRQRLLLTFQNYQSTMREIEININKHAYVFP